MLGSGDLGATPGHGDLQIYPPCREIPFRNKSQGRVGECRDQSQTGLLLGPLSHGQDGHSDQETYRPTKECQFLSKSREKKLNYIILMYLSLYQ